MTLTNTAEDVPHWHLYYQLPPTVFHSGLLYPTVPHSTFHIEHCTRENTIMRAKQNFIHVVYTVHVCVVCHLALSSIGTQGQRSDSSQPYRPSNVWLLLPFGLSILQVPVLRVAVAAIIKPRILHKRIHH